MEDDGGSTLDKFGVGKRKRTNTGCITCRIRRVKCDETKPSCNRCAYSKRVCDGYLAPSPASSCSPTDGQGPSARKTLSRRALALAVRQLNAPGPSARLLSPSPYLGDDVACFDFFRFRLTTALSESKESQAIRGFWNYTLLQASHTEPAIWLAVAALGALYRRWEVVSSGSKRGRTSSHTGITRNIDDFDYKSANSSTDDEDDSSHGSALTLHSVRLAEQAITCYTKALGLAKAVRDPSSMLVLSLALAAIANLSGKWVDSSVHYQAGQRIMSQLRIDFPGKPMTELQINAAESLAKLGLQLLSFQEQSAPHPCTEMREVGVCSSGEPFPRSLVSSQDQRIWGLHRANIELVNILRRILLEAGLHTPGDLPKPVDSTRKQIRCDINRDLANWERDTFNILSNTTDPMHRTTLDVLSIKLLHTLARLFVAAGVMDPNTHSELSWDAHLTHFDRILALAVLILRAESQQNPLQLCVMSLDEPTINLALWITATRCRHPIVRRRALQLLRGVRRLEGVWMSNSAAAVAARMVDIEEEGLCNLMDRLPQWSTVVEPVLTSEIEAEDREPRLWLGRDAERTMAPASKWLVPGDVLVPMERRITQVDVTAEYDAHIGRSRADLVLIFAGPDEHGFLRRGRESVYF